MAFWADSTLEPKRQHRFLFFASNSAIPTFVVKSVNKPGFTVGETSHNFYGHYFYYPGQLQWDSLSVTLVDPVDPDTSERVLTMLRRSGYAIPDAPLQSGALRSISKAEAVDALGPQIRIEQRGANDQLLETWRFYNPWIKGAKFGTLAYDSDAMLDISLDIRYDFADFTKA